MRNAFALCLAVLFLAPGAAAAQERGAAAWLEELNRDVWVPFLAGVAKYEDTGYVGVRSKDYIRVQSEGRLILSYETYVDDTRSMMASYKDRGTRLTMEVRFEDRITDGRFASERGITKVVFAPKEGEARTFYGRFHTVSRKENGVWRILVDYAAPASERVGEEEFKRARDMNDLEPFRCYMRYPGKKLDCGK